MKKGFKFDKDKLLEALSKRAQGFFYSEEVLEYGEPSTEKKEKGKAKAEDDNSESKELVEKNISKKTVSKNEGFQNHDIYSEREKTSGEDETEPIGILSNVNNENPQNLILLKKKVTTHYIPPDITAVKMLFENFGQEIGVSNNVLDSMSDEELLEIKSELIAEIKNE